MNVYELADPLALRPRAHPWTDAESNPTHRYWDFRARPELIRTVLEDLAGWSEHPAIETFYRLLEWLNGSGSAFESNDCAFVDPTIDESEGANGRFVCSGRVMILYRDLAANTSPEQVRWLTQALARAAEEIDPDFESGALGVTITQVAYTTLPGPAARQRGEQLMLSFWAWGRDEAEVMTHLERTLAGMTTALRGVSRAIQAKGETPIK